MSLQGWLEVNSCLFVISVIYIHNTNLFANLIYSVYFFFRHLYLFLRLIM